MCNKCVCFNMHDPKVMRVKGMIFKAPNFVLTC